MSKSSKYFFLILMTPVFLSMQFCKKQTDAFAITTNVNDYYPLETGKYIIYQMDSTVFTNFETTKEIHSYQVKDIIDAEMTDNLDRRSYRIRRMIRDSAGLTPWVDNAAFMVTPLENAIEVVENNLRFIKLVKPIREWYTWEGNSYINTTDDLNDLAYWYYTYANVGSAFDLDGLRIDNSITVNQEDYSSGDPVAEPNSVASKVFGQEVYGKDIGLVYKDFIHWLYQRRRYEENCRVILPMQDTIPCAFNIDCDSLATAKGGYAICDTTYKEFYYDGYGIKLKMLEHN
jgi:hypothetical protein